MPIIPPTQKLAAKISSMPTPTPLWEGPCAEGPMGGVTQSMIGRYLSCKERFRIHTIEGWQANERFEPALEYGNMWHAAEEALAGGNDWMTELTKYVEKLYTRFPMQREMVDDWTNKCVAQFPIYVDHWSQHPDVLARTPLLQEQVFDVPYKLLSGRVVRLRGKWDSVDLVDGSGIWIQENKTKSSIDRKKIERQLRFDLQTMLYTVTLYEYGKWGDKADGTYTESEGHFASDVPAYTIKGIRYNVIRRSAHKSVASMMKKITEDREDKRIGEWFDRWNIEIGQRDVEVFKRTCLDPVLENLCDDYEWWEWCMKHKHDPFDWTERNPDHRLRHYRLPYGVYNVVADGGFSDVDSYLESGSTAGLRRTTTLFPELDNA